MAVQKVVISVNELEPNKNNLDEGPDSRKKLCKRKQIPKSGSSPVIYQYHCPVDGCVYDVNSARHFSRLKYLQQHYKKVHAVKLFFCEKCTKGFAKLTDRNTHLASCGSIYSCSCGAKYTSREALLTHAKRNVHNLPENHRSLLGKAHGVKVSSSNCESAHVSSNQPPSNNPSPIILMLNVVDNADHSKHSNLPPLDASTSALKKPCLILPKSGPFLTFSTRNPVHVLPNKLPVSRNTEIGIQTGEFDPRFRDRSCLYCARFDALRESHKHLIKLYKRAIKKTAGTQTSKITLSRKRACKTSCLVTQSTQTDASQQLIDSVVSSMPLGTSTDVTNASTQTSAEIVGQVVSQTLGPSLLPPNDYAIQEQLYPFGGSNPWPLPSTELPQTQFSGDALVVNNKFCQTIEELDVDVNFSMSSAVSSGTQTSPQIAGVPKEFLSTDPLLPASLHRFLDMGNLPMMQDYHLSSNSCPQSQSGQFSRHYNLPTVQHLSSETQTDFNLSLLLSDDDDNGHNAHSDEDDVGIISSNIQTQTSSEDLEAIPYDQLLSHMETQTSDPFLFSDLGNFCDIQTQTMYADNNPSLVDMHTQTYLHQPERLSAQAIHMETQTLLSLLDGTGDCSFMDSHTQTSSMMSLFDY